MPGADNADKANFNERSSWHNLKKKLPVLCKLYTKHELSIERLISLYLHVGLLKAHHILRDYCTRKLASINRNSEVVDDPDEETPSTFSRILNWVNEKLQNWATDKAEEPIESLRDAQNVIIYPEKLNLVIFPPSLTDVNEALEDNDEDDDSNQDLWEETGDLPSHRSQRMVQNEAIAEKPTFSEYLKTNLNFESLFPKTERDDSHDNLKHEHKSHDHTLAPMSDVLKQEFEKFEHLHQATPLPISEPKPVPNPPPRPPPPTPKPEDASQLTHIPVVVLYIIPVLLILAVLILLSYLVFYLKRKSTHRDDGESRERLLDVRIEQVDPTESSTYQLDKLQTKGDKKTRCESYEDDYSKKLVSKSTPMWNSLK